jgi:hypothetical protein
MKKFIAFIMCLCMVFTLAACGGSGEAPANNDVPVQTTPKADAETTAPAAQESEQEEGFCFLYNCTEIKLYAPAEPIVEALGEPRKYTESPSCAFDGLDKTYFYGSFYMDTYPDDGHDFVYGWWFADDSISTQEGIYIGATQADVEKAYGADCFNGENAYIITRNGGTLTIIVEEGIVTSIQYAIILN